MAVTLLDDWSFVDNDDPHLQSTTSPSAGSNRVLVLAYGAGNHDIDAFGWGTPVVRWDEDNSSVSPVATYKWGDGSDDCPRYFAIWDESQIAAATGGRFWWGANEVAYEFFGYAVYGGVKQTGLDSLTNDGTNISGSASSADVTTTSTSSERIIVVGAINTSTRNVSDSDTLTEKHDVGSSPTTNARYYLGEGAGGDGTTTLTISTTGSRPNFSSIVLPAAGITPKAMYHYRNHGKIF